jgi:streptogramin lyase
VVVLYDGQTFRPVVFPGDYYTYNINKSFSTSNNELWLTIYSEGIETAYLIHPDGSVDIAPDQPMTEPKDEFEQSFYPQGWTPEGLLLFSNNVIGLYKDGNLKTFSLPEQDDEISALVRKHSVIGFAPDGALWLTENNEYRALIRYDGVKKETIFSGENVNSIRVGWVSKINDQGEIWAMDRWVNYLSCFKVGEKPAAYQIRFSPIDFDFAPDGSIWLLGNDGYIARVHPKNLDKNRVTVPEYVRIGDGLVENSLDMADRILVAPNGDVWVHVANTGLYRYDGSTWKYMGMYKMDDPTNFAINKLGEVWAGYNHHLFKHDGKGWINYQRNCIFPNHIITAHDDAAWFINGCDGVMRFDEVEWTHYTKDKEMAGVIPYQILTAPDGALWFISGNAWVRYQP